MEPLHVTDSGEAPHPDSWFLVSESSLGPEAEGTNDFPTAFVPHCELDIYLKGASWVALQTGVLSLSSHKRNYASLYITQRSAPCFRLDMCELWGTYLHRKQQLGTTA